jgi:2'-5' RNA ligase
VSAPLRRGFLAVVPPPAVIRWTEAVTDAARSPDDGELRWTRLDQRHLTLQFLGRVDDADALAESVAETVRRIAPFTLSLGGAGAFPSVRRATVLWLGVTIGAEELAALAGAIATVTELDDRPFVPHLTLARARAPRDLRALVERLASDPVEPYWTVNEVVMFDSDTRAGGAVHTEQARFALRANPRRR